MKTNEEILDEMCFLDDQGNPINGRNSQWLQWISVKDKEPPKDEPFLALTTGRIEMMEWKERIINAESKGWFGFYCPCSCCSGYCSDKFKFWMPLPEPPK